MIKQRVEMKSALNLLQHRNVQLFREASFKFKEEFRGSVRLLCNILLSYEM